MQQIDAKLNSQELRYKSPLNYQEAKLHTDSANPTIPDDDVDQNEMNKVLKAYDMLCSWGAFPVVCTPISGAMSHDPPAFHSKESESAEDWLPYVIKYTAFKNMPDAAIAWYFPLLLRNATADWYDLFEQATNNS